METPDLFELVEEIQKIIIIEYKLLKHLTGLKKDREVDDTAPLDNLIVRQEEIIKTLEESQSSYEKYTKI